MLFVLYEKDFRYRWYRNLQQLFFSPKFYEKIVIIWSHKMALLWLWSTSVHLRLQVIFFGQNLKTKLLSIWRHKMTMFMTPIKKLTLVDTSDRCIFLLQLSFLFCCQNSTTKLLSIWRHKMTRLWLWSTSWHTIFPLMIPPP